MQIHRVLITPLLLLLTLMVAATAFGQPANVPQDDAAGCASVEAQRLAFLIGEWKVRSRFRLSREPEKWEETRARAKIRYLFENCVMTEQLEGTRDRHPFKATAIYAHNRNSRKYEWVGVDSEHGFLTLYQGPLNGNEVVLESSVEISGRTTLLRRVVTKHPAGGFEVRSQRSNDGGQSWDTTWYLVYSR